MSGLKELRLRAGLTQDQLADLAGTNKSQISKLESGERALSDKWKFRLAPHLGVQPADLLEQNSDTISPQSSQPGVGQTLGRPARLTPAPQGRKDLPVRGFLKAGPQGGVVFEKGDAVEFVHRTAELEGVKDAYAMQIPEWFDSMIPAAWPGDYVLFNPRKQAFHTNLCAVHLVQDDEAILAALVRRSDDEWVFRKYNPDQEVVFAADEVRAVHVATSVHSEKP